ncbi:MAG: orotate phosphoribosyltransferase [bacterium]|nr:orotate phosphoribosyltransferase [bacterium]
MEIFMNVKQMFVDANALLEGHFMLSSGLHSNFYMQSAKVLQDTENAQVLGKMIADAITKQGLDINLVVAPAMGGVIIGHEVASNLGLNFVFTERVSGKMTLRRGFEILKGSKIILVEDVFTTGKSTREVITLLDSIGVETVACASIVDRSGGTVSFNVPKISLLNLDIKSYNPDSCPMCIQGFAITKPGSRFVNRG